MKSHPVGTVGGGGWQASTVNRSVSKSNKDQVLSQMFDMFLDAVDAEIIESVVESCQYDSLKAMEALISINSCDTPGKKYSAAKSLSNISQDQDTSVQKASGLDAICAAYDSNDGDDNDDDVIVENESEVEISGTSTLSSNLLKPIPVVSSFRRSTAVVANGDSRASCSSTGQTKPDVFQSALSSNFVSNDFYSEVFQSSLKTIKWYIENGMKIMILLRGCPGSGKSFLAKLIVESIQGEQEQHVFSTDDYFLTQRGQYNFQASLLQDAHAWNQKRAFRAVEIGLSPVIIDNTHTQLWEMDAYVQMALPNGYAIEVLEPQTQWFANAKGLYKHNIHGIPLDKIELMLNRYENNITVDTLLRRAFMYNSKYVSSAPQPASKPVGMRRTSSHLQEPEMSEPFKIQALWKTGAIKKVKANHIPPLLPKPDKPTSNAWCAKDNDIFAMPCANSASSLYEIPIWSNSSDSNLCKKSSKSEASQTYENNVHKSVENISKSLSCGDDCIKREPNSLVTCEVGIVTTSPDADNTQAVSKTDASYMSSSQANIIIRDTLHSRSSDEQIMGMVCNLQSTDVYVSSEDEELPEHETFTLESRKDIQCSNTSSKCDIEDLTTFLSNVAVSSAETQESFKVPELSSQKDELNEQNISQVNSVIHVESNGIQPLERFDITIKDDILHDPVSELQEGDSISFPDFPVQDENHSSASSLTKPLPTEIPLKSDSVINSSHHCSTTLNPSDGVAGLEVSLEPDSCKTEDLFKLDFSCLAEEGGGFDQNKSLCNSNIVSCFPVESSSSAGNIPSQVSVPLDPWTSQVSDDGLLSTQQRGYNSLEPKPPRSPKVTESEQPLFLLADSSIKEESSWAFCEGNNVSWQTIDKNQEEFYGKSTSRIEDFSNTQREKFISLDEKKCNYADKDTMTHHSDFLLLNSLSSDPNLENGVRMLVSKDRDINSGRIPFGKRACLKLMLDKSTSTECDFSFPEDKEDNEKLEELCRLFPKIPMVGLVELLEKCQGDVNWVSNLLLDTANDVFSSAFFQVPSNDSSLTANSQFVASTCPVGETQAPETELLQKELPVHTEEYLEEAKELKRHLENSITISDDNYSPHVLSIRNFRKGLREGAIPKQVASTNHTQFLQSPSPVPEQIDSAQLVRAKSEEESGEEEEDYEDLELVVGHDLIQQLFDKFGGSELYNGKKFSPVVKVPVNLARHLHYYLITSLGNHEDVEETAVRLQYEEDERIAWQLYEDMRETGQHSQPSPPQLQEIMDFQMAEAIYQADLNALNRNSEETMATILAKRLLQESFPNIDPKILHNMLQAHNNSFEETVKVLRQSLTNDDAVFSATGLERRDKDLLDRAKKASLVVVPQVPNHSSSTDDKEDDDYGDAMADAAAYRDAAAALQEQRKECYLKARDAFKRKERSVAAYYAMLANCHKQHIEQAHARAAAALVSASIASREPDTLDLHYLRVSEAVQVLDLFLDRHISRMSPSRNSLNLYVITGRGARSVGGKSVIRPVVMKRIKDRNLEFTLENPGLLKVTITRNSSLSCRT